MLCLLVCYQAWMQGNGVGMWILASEVIWLFPYKTSLFHNHAVYIFGGVFSLFLYHFNRIVSFFIPKTWTTGKIKSSLSIHVPGNISSLLTECCNKVNFKNPASPASAAAGHRCHNQSFNLSNVFIQSCLSLCDPWTVALQAPLTVDFPGKNTGVGCHFLLQGLFLIQGWNLGLPLGRRILYHWATWEVIESM